MNALIYFNNFCSDWPKNTNRVCLKGLTVLNPKIYDM